MIRAHRYSSPAADRVTPGSICNCRAIMVDLKQNAEMESRCGDLPAYFVGKSPTGADTVASSLRKRRIPRKPAPQRDKKPIFGGISTRPVVYLRLLQGCPTQRRGQKRSDYRAYRKPKTGGESCPHNTIPMAVRTKKAPQAGAFFLFSSICFSSIRLPGPKTPVWLRPRWSNHVPTLF